MFKTAFPTYPLDYVLTIAKTIAKNQTWLQECYLAYCTEQKSFISTDGTLKNKITSKVQNDHGDIYDPQHNKSCFWLDKLHC